MFFLLLEQKTTQRSHQPFKKSGYQGRVWRVENHPPLQQVGQSELRAEPIRGKIVIVEEEPPECFDERKTSVLADDYMYPEKKTCL